ncbi:MAG: hypothetical protein AAF297_07385 [Planctomycetota bacterium]
MVHQLMIAQTVAPEDLRKGQFVAVLRTVHECFPYYCDESLPVEDRTRPVRFSHMPEGTPAVYRVEAVCVPFVLVERCGSGKPRTLDVRRVQLASVDPRFGELFAKRFKPEKSEGASTDTTKDKVASGNATGAD